MTYCQVSKRCSPSVNFYSHRWKKLNCESKHPTKCQQSVICKFAEIALFLYKGKPLSDTDKYDREQSALRPTNWLQTNLKRSSLCCLDLRKDPSDKQEIHWFYCKQFFFVGSTLESLTIWRRNRKNYLTSTSRQNELICCCRISFHFSVSDSTSRPKRSRTCMH